MKHVKEKWATFVASSSMDGKQGVNSEEQVNLLNLVKESMDTKEVPVIILCNKVDRTTKSRLDSSQKLA
jgi:GTP1/Obg family GTP-binding protein